MRTINRNIVSGLIFSSDGKLFQGMKNPASGGVYADCWHLPGGGIDEGEEKTEALIREIMEETGIDITPYTIELIDDKDSGETEKKLKTGEQVICKMKFFVYKIIVKDKTADQIKVKLNDDLVNYRWSDLSEIQNIKNTPPSTALFKRLGYLK